MEMTRREFFHALGGASGAAFLSACGRADELSPSSLDWRPAYAKLEDRGEFAARVEEAYDRFAACDLCPHRCGVDRLAGERGFCQATSRVKVHSHSPHFGEELPLVGQRGSGTIFFSHCNLRCVFCQNYPIAHEGRGREVSDEDLADMMLNLQRRGCHNINVVTPTHVMPNILKATRIALKKGLRLPLCYNTGGYDTVEMVKLLDSVVDLYLPDLKFMDGEASRRYAVRGPADYPTMARRSIVEMHRQVGDLQTDARGVARRGLMVRHLVMPNRVSGTREFVRWVATSLSLDTYINIMSQYRVEHRAFEYEPIARAITSREYVEAMEWALEAGLRNLDQRSLAQLDIHRRRLRR